MRKGPQGFIVTRCLYCKCVYYLLWIISSTRWHCWVLAMWSLVTWLHRHSMIKKRGLNIQTKILGLYGQLFGLISEAQLLQLQFDSNTGLGKDRKLLPPRSVVLNAFICIIRRWCYKSQVIKYISLCYHSNCFLQFNLNYNSMTLSLIMHLWLLLAAVACVANKIQTFKVKIEKFAAKSAISTRSFLH